MGRISLYGVFAATSRRHEARLAAGLLNKTRRWLGIAAMLAAGIAASPARADDVPFEWNGIVSSHGVAKLENGHLSGDFDGRSGSASFTGDVSGGQITISVSGNLGGKPGNCSGNGSAPLASGVTIVQISVRCHNSWSGTLALHMPSSAGAPGEPPSAAQYPIDPIDQVFVAITPAKVRERPDVSSARVKTVEVGQKITVMGKLKGQDWYEVSENDKPVGFVVTAQLVPESDYQARSIAPAAPSSASAATTQSSTPAGLAGIDFGNYQALVIGNDNYRNGLPNLKTAKGDAQAVAAMLKSAYGFKVTLLLNATREQIIGTLAKLRKTLTWDDNLLIYYAGHGSYDQQADQGYWLPVDAVPDDPSNWVSNTDLTNMLKAMQARHVMVVADSCYSGTLTRDGDVEIKDPGYIQRMVQKKARTVMTSGGLEPVADSGGSGHSVFATAFLAALQQNSGVMDAQAFFAKVREPVVLAAPQTPEYSNLRFAGHEGGDFVFVRKQ
jgi:caspase domain-containing protein/SH3 domain-containing protein